MANRLARLPMPLNFLLGCSDTDLSDFELNKLATIADLRSELHNVLDTIIDEMSQAALAAWFSTIDRPALKQAIENPDDIMAWARVRIRDGQRSKEELVPRAALAPGSAHLAAAIRYQQRNIAAGLCAVCTKPLARGSVRFCEEHLAAHRARYKPKGAKGALPGSIAWLYDGVFESMHGKQPGTLAALARTRERQHRTTEKEKLLYSRVAEQMGVSPEHVRCVALGQRRSEGVSAAIEKEIQQEATEVLAALAETSEQRKKKKGRASSAFGVSVEKLIG